MRAPGSEGSPDSPSIPGPSAPGYVDVDEKVLNHFLGGLVTLRPEIESAAVELREGHFTVEVRVRRVIRATVRAAFSVESIELRGRTPRLRLRRHGHAELGGDSVLTDLAFRAVGDPIERLAGWVSFLRFEDDLLEVELADTPLAGRLDERFAGRSLTDWVPLMAIECREGVLRLVLSCGGEGDAQAPSRSTASDS